MLCMYVCMYVCMCICMYVCMYVWMYVCMYVWMYVCMNVCMYECMYVCMNVCMYVWMYVCMNVCMYVWMYVCMNVCMYVWMYVCMNVWMYVCMYACMHACMYVCIHFIYICNIDIAASINGPASQILVTSLDRRKSKWPLLVFTLGEKAVAMWSWCFSTHGQKISHKSPQRFAETNFTAVLAVVKLVKQLGTSQTSWWSCPWREPHIYPLVPLVIKRGSGKSPRNGGLHGKIVYKEQIFHCHVSLQEGNLFCCWSWGWSTSTLRPGYSNGKCYVPTVAQWKTNIMHPSAHPNWNKWPFLVLKKKCLRQLYMGVSSNVGTRKRMVYNGQSIFKWMIWGYLYFRKPPYCLLVM